MVPEGWRKRSLEDVAVIQTGVAKGKKNITDPVALPYLRVANVQDGYLDLSEIKKIEVASKDVERYRLQKDDIVLTEGGDFDKLGRGTLWRGQISECLHQNHVFAVRVDQQQLHPEFFAAQTNSRYGKSYFLSCAKRSTNLASINSTQLKQFPALLPPLAEQKKIAEILSTWDRAIEVAEAQLDCARTQKRALMQQLLTGRRRFPEFEGQEWKEVRFEEVFVRVRRKNTVANNNVLTISAQHGLVSQETYFNKRVAAKDLSGYTLLEEGDFAYNKSYSAGYPLGAIKMLEVDEPGVVSSLYLCFALQNTGEHSREFFRHFFEAGCFNRQIYQIAQEGARNHGLLNVSATDFFRAYLRVPPLAEQRLIARTIGTAEVQEEVHRRELEKLRTEKKALMQQLLTGKRRVSV